MSISKRKMKKKKEHEKIAKERVLKRREIIIAVKSKENQEQKKEKKDFKRIKKIQKDLQGLNMWSDDVLLNLNSKTTEQLKKNIQILKALEQEHEELKSKRSVINEDLESKGLITLEEKMNYLHHDLASQQGLLEDFDQINENLDSKEISDVSVVKAET